MTRSWIDRATVLWPVVQEALPVIGERFDLLVVMKQVVSRKVPQFWCRCDCGDEVVATARELQTRRVRSCGHCRRPKRRSTSVGKQRASKR